ncbi:MAG: ribosome maturation factor RimM [Candidatus Ancillula trichonymphae]|nr:ribosome maturation factor RimM [Candidatus Ancillula trichonymphae]
MLLNVAKIGASVGVQGEVRLHLTTDSPSVRFTKGAEFVVESGNRNLKVAGVRRRGTSYVVQFEGVDSRNLADEIRGSVLQVEVDIFSESDDEFYYAALEGLEVREIATGHTIGSVKSVLEYPAQDLLEVALTTDESAGAGRSTQKNYVFVPFVRQIVRVVNLQEKYLEVNLPDGLLDEVH